jgi:hypothetical protein
MRAFPLFVLLMAGVPAPGWAQQPPPPQASGAAEPASQPVSEDKALDLPVSLDRIREGLARPPALPSLRALERIPDFRTEVEGWRNELFRPEDVRPGPIPAGGLYAYEIQRLFMSSVDNPLRQPYAAFSQGQLLEVALMSVVQTLAARTATRAVKTAYRSAQERAAREEVERAMAEFCAVQPNGGAGIVGCPSPAAK